MTAALSGAPLAKPSPSRDEGLVMLLRCGGCGELKPRGELAAFDAVQAKARDRYRWSMRLCAACRREAE